MRDKRPARSDADMELVRRMLDAARAGADVRGRKVRRLKAAIKVRAYENDLKLAVAVDRLQMLVGWPAMFPQRRKAARRVAAKRPLREKAGPGCGPRRAHSALPRRRRARAGDSSD